LQDQYICTQISWRKYKFSNGYEVMIFWISISSELSLIIPYYNKYILKAYCRLVLIF